MPTIRRNGTTVYYESNGVGPTLVFAHALMCDGDVFKHQVAALQHDYRVINVDLRGHGRSGASATPFTLYDLADDMIAILDAENVSSSIWVGLSLGGFIALRSRIISRPA